MTPIEKLFHTEPSPHRWPGLGRIMLFVLLQLAAAFVFFWSGIFTLIAAVWEGQIDYIWIFLLILFGFELISLRIILRRNIFVWIGAALLIIGLWINHGNRIQRTAEMCLFIEQANCREVIGGYLCRDNIGNIRTINRFDIAKCIPENNI